MSIDSGLLHLSDSLNKKSLGIYTTTSPKVWGGISSRFHYVTSKHMLTCKNYNDSFGMCINNKKKCSNISGKRDDIDVEIVFKKIKKILNEKN